MSSCDEKCEGKKSCSKDKISKSMRPWYLPEYLEKSVEPRGIPGDQGCEGPQGAPGVQGSTGMPGPIFVPLEVPTQDKIPPKEPHKTCAICFDAIADIVLLPCSHNLYCSICIAATPKPIQCPTCRDVVAGFALMKPFNFT